MHLTHGLFKAALAGGTSSAQSRYLTILYFHLRQKSWLNSEAAVQHGTVYLYKVTTSHSLCFAICSIPILEAASNTVTIAKQGHLTSYEKINGHESVCALSNCRVKHLPPVLNLALMV